MLLSHRYFKTVCVSNLALFSCVTATNPVTLHASDTLVHWPHTWPLDITRSLINFCILSVFFNFLKFLTLFFIFLDDLYGLKFDIAFDSTLLYSSLLYSTILYSSLLYSTILYSTLFFSTLLNSSLLYSSLLYSTLLYYTLLYCTLLYFSPL